MTNSLPKSTSIDTQRLGRLFDNMSESYKLFWFQAIVSKIYEGELTMSYDALINEMIADGWYMVSEYKLNLGPSDTLEKVIETAFSRVNLKSSEKKEVILTTLSNSDDKELIKMKKTLTLNVPKRLQAPFLDDIKGKIWDSKDIISLINSHDNLLYYFSSLDGLNSSITVNEEFEGCGRCHAKDDEENDSSFSAVFYSVDDDTDESHEHALSESEQPNIKIIVMMIR